jgi:hypothetical protein
MNGHPSQTKPPDDDLEEGRLFWREAGRRLVRKSIDSVEETSRQIITVAGILEGLYFHAISFSDIRTTLDNTSLAIYILPLVLLLLSLVVAFAVFFPERYRINIFSSEGSKAIYEDIVRSKLLTMRIAAVLLMIGVAGIIVAMILYLRGG